MGLLIAGLVVFLGTHSISIVAPNWRDRTVARIGALPWRGLYSLFAIGGFVLLVYGFGQARLHPVPIYIPPHWMHHVTALLMLPVFPLLFAAYLPGRIKTAMKHPMLVAIKLWAFAHLLSNGMLADLVLFGSLLAWAVFDRISFKHRTQRPLPGAPPSKANDVLAVVLGLATYGAFAMWLHLKLIGVAPFP